MLWKARYGDTHDVGIDGHRVFIDARCAHTEPVDPGGGMLELVCLRLQTPQCPGEGFDGVCFGCTRVKQKLHGWAGRSNKIPGVLCLRPVNRSPGPDFRSELCRQFADSGPRGCRGRGRPASYSDGTSGPEGRFADRKHVTPFERSVQT